MTREQPNLLALLDRLGIEEAPVTDTEQRLRQQQRVVLAIENRVARLHENASSLKRRDDLPVRARASVQTHGRRLVQMRGWGIALGLAASVALITFGWAFSKLHAGSIPVAASEQHVGHVRMVEGETQVIRPGDYESRVSGAFELGKGDLVLTAHASRALVTLLADIRIELSADTRLRLGDTADLHQSDVWLQRGKARFDVGKRPPNGKFSVHAPDADITVHGTNFSVEVRQSSSTIVTSVSVTEGRVSVYGSGKTRWLGAGEVWTSGDESAPSTERAQALPAADISASHHGATTIRHTAPSASSSLGAESLLFSAAMAAKRRGDDADALRQLDDFLNRYPRSQLYQNARVERFRLLKRLGRIEQAASEARDYIVAFPEGFAHDEARGLAVPSATPRRE